MIGTLFLSLILDHWTWPQLCSATDFSPHVSRFGSQFASGACFYVDVILHLLMLSGSPADSLFSFATSLLNHWRFFSLPNTEWLKHPMPLLSNAPRWKKSRSCNTSFLVVDYSAWPCLRYPELGTSCSSFLWFLSVSCFPSLFPSRLP